MAFEKSKKRTQGSRVLLGAIEEEEGERGRDVVCSRASHTGHYVIEISEKGLAGLAGD